MRDVAISTTYGNRFHKLVIAEQTSAPQSARNSMKINSKIENNNEMPTAYLNLKVNCWHPESKFLPAQLVQPNPFWVLLSLGCHLVVTRKQRPCDTAELKSALETLRFGRQRESF
jgi:hypothetical protein